MQIEWDEAKRIKTLRERSIDFAALEEFFETEVSTLENRRGNYGEERFVSFGFFRGRPIVVFYTFRDDVVRIISARRASKYEQKTYYP